MIPENFTHKLKAAIGTWSIESEIRTGPWMRRLFLSPQHVSALAEHLSPVLEEIIQLSKDANVKSK